MPALSKQKHTLNKLNKRQREAVKSISHPTLVLAGAGSGKTSVITQKIAYLVNDCGYKGKHIAAVTFTNKAAREMKNRIGQILDKKLTRGLMVSTFHTLGLTIIRQEIYTLGLTSGFSIFDNEDARNLIKDIIIQGGEADLDLIDFIQHTISQFKSSLLRPEQAVTQAQSPQEAMIANVYLKYQHSLQAYNAVDFDDLINTPVFLFRKYPDILERWQKRIRYLLVDEYQDTNESQYELVKLLVGDRHGLTVVGDDDQSIYAWRGAKPENLNQLQVDYPTLNVIKLEQNYRSTSAILNCANKLIANNPHTFEKRLWSNLSIGAPIRIIKVANDKAESERVVNEIIDHRIRGGHHYHDYAILYRGNHQSRTLELALREANLPYQLTGGTSFFARSEIKDIMAYLRLLVNPADNNAFLRIINVPRRKIGSTTLQNLSRLATAKDCALFDAIALDELSEHVGSIACTHLMSFYNWLQNLMRLCATENPINTIEEMIDDIAYEAWLHQNSPSAAGR